MLPFQQITTVGLDRRVAAGVGDGIARALGVIEEPNRSCGSAEGHYAPTSMWRILRRLELMMLPAWLCWPLMVLGGIYLIAKPLGVVDHWVFYLYALILSLASGLLFHWRYQVSVLERSEDWVLLRCGRRNSTVPKHQTTEEPT